MFEIFLNPGSNLKRIEGYFAMLLTDVCCWAGWRGSSGHYVLEAE